MIKTNKKINQLEKNQRFLRKSSFNSRDFCVAISSLITGSYPYPKHKYFAYWLIALVSLICLSACSTTGENNIKNGKKVDPINWQQAAVKRARIMSRVKWTPVNEGMPVKGGGYFKKGTEYTGVPYSSVKSVGRYIGFDIFLKTFLAAVQNPLSVVYTENLSVKVKNAGCYYGKVCSSYTSYALGCGVWYNSYLHGPPYRESVSQVEAQSAQTVKIGDVIFTPRSQGSHVEIVTDITKNDNDKVTHVRVEDSWPWTTRNRNHSAENFNAHLKHNHKKLYRISNLDTWREDNKAESFLFPNYKEDSATPVINRVLLLDRGDWVTYQRGQIVKINIMDKDSQGVAKLVIKRGNKIIEEIVMPGKGVVERAFPTCGDYSTYCVMNDGSKSQACEFSICDLDLIIPDKKIALGKPLEIKFTSNNMKSIILFLRNSKNSFNTHNLFITEKDRKKGKIVIPGNLLQDAGHAQIWLIAENRYGRLKKRQDIFIDK
jgi:hypothetical protein